MKRRRAVWRGLAAGLVAALPIGAGAAADGPARDRFDVVVIDAGHGGEDAGARGTQGLVEKDLVLDVAARLALALQQEGLKIVMTRHRDTFVPLERRTALANDARGDLFLSIHANAAREADVGGTETFFMALEASDESAQRVAERENAAFGEAATLAAPSRDPLVSILGDLMTTDYMRDSNDFAKLAQTELGRLSLRSRGVKQAPFVVLAGVQMPSVLVEIGFLTHPEDESALASDAGRDGVVSALTRAVREFGRRYDARRGIGREDPPAAPVAPAGR